MYTVCFVDEDVVFSSDIVMVFFLKLFVYLIHSCLISRAHKDLRGCTHFSHSVLFCLILRKPSILPLLYVWYIKEVSIVKNPGLISSTFNHSRPTHQNIGIKYANLLIIENPSQSYTPTK